MTSTWPPVTNADLRAAVSACLAEERHGNCTAYTHGPPSTWDVSRMTEFNHAFDVEGDAFNHDVGPWDV